ncbi:MAG TPA: zinc-dependent metalloprotease [Saprospiraceae bacterium]|jgi:hypothetical protein|nr:zinc-dependent metalloprotease [Saprospiraceae bacterium]
MRNVIAAFIIMIVAVMTAHTQSALRPRQLVEQAHLEGKSFTPISLFERAVNFRSEVEITPIEDYTLLNLDSEGLRQLAAAPPAALLLELPFESGRLQLELVRTDADPIPVRESQPTDFGRNSFTGLHYRGVVRGQEGSVAAVSFVAGEVMGLVSSRQEGNLVLGRLNAENAAPVHILYRDAPVLEAMEMDCHTADDGPDYLPHQLQEVLEFRNEAKCTRIYFEVDYDIFTDKGGTAGAISYVTALFNQVAALYANENIGIAISEIFVWTTNSPYMGSNPGTLLNQIQTLRTQFNGHLAHLLSYKPSGGIAVLSGLCHPLTIAKFGVSGIRSTFSNVPTYSWSVMVIAHELGHQFGSKHTHACAWNGNNTAIDGCAGFVEGSCALPPMPAVGTGTIMSYCHVTSVGINLSLGFGAQPGNVMRNAVAAAPCLPVCTTSGGGGGGGNPTPTCANNTVILRLVLDNYGPETTWRLTNSTGQVVKSGGPYPKGMAGTAILDTMCLPNGCYTFRILDTYGDGICCNYGNGSYTLRNAAGQVLITGGQFGFEESKSICVPNTPPATGCVQVNFAQTPVVSYGGPEDLGSFTLLSSNTVLRIQNNAWKAVMLNYNVTPNTKLQFDFASTAPGEIHGIGFDNDSIIGPERTFKLYGSQNWGITNFNNYPGYNSWINYTIPVGQFYTGQFNRLFFAADHDASPANGNSFFRNIRIYEGTACSNLIPDNEMELAALLEEEPGGQRVQLFPNPVSDELQLRFTAPLSADEPVILRIFSAAGQLVQQETLSSAQAKQPVQVAQLRSGAYLLHIQSGAYSENLKFIKH